ncbi:MAG: sensor histidine kinase [Bacteroidia bacterium]
MNKKEVIILPDIWPAELKNSVMGGLGTENYFYIPTSFQNLDPQFLENCFLIIFDTIAHYELLQHKISRSTFLVFHSSIQDAFYVNDLATKKKVFHIPNGHSHLLLQSLKLIGAKHQTEISVIDGFEQIRMNEEKFRNFVRNISDIITLIDHEGKILYQSASIMQKMGYEENELKGKSIFDIIHPDDIPIVAINFKEAVLSKSNGRTTELRLRDKNGEYLYLEANGNNQLDNPLIGAFIINSRDITSRKIAENEKNYLINELSKALYDLRQFAFLTTHSIRSPLTNIMGLVKIIQDEGAEVLNDERYLNGIEESAFKIDEILVDLIKILSIRDPKENHKTEVFFNEILNNAINQLHEAINKHQVKIDLDFYHAPKINFNKDFIENIFIQLMNNSLQFKHPDRLPYIQIQSFVKDHYICLRFKDNGVGMQVDKVKDKIFGLYQKFHRQSGKGFGLYLIANQIHTMGGQISLEDSSENGTSFLIQFQS